jgi:phosphoribosylglycinamide formyltransferase-1
MEERSADKLKVGVLASGRGSNLQAIIDASEEGRIDARVVCVVSDAGDAYALERARKHGIDAFHINPRDFADKGEYEACISGRLKERGVQLICLAGYMRIVGPHLISEFPNRILNIHPALLPSFPGLHGQRQALEHGVKFSGCTVHFVDEGVDTGPVIIQSVVPVFDDDTEETLAARILIEEHKIYPQAIQFVARGRLTVEGRRVRLKGAATVPDYPPIQNPRVVI